MSTSRLDAVYRRILITKFFTKGWGKPENLRRLFEFRKVVSNRDECFKLVERDYPVTITKQETLSDCKIYEGYFITPLERYLPGIVPNIARKAHFQVLLPLHWPENNCKPVCLHLAGTGDHFFWRRRNLMVKPLLKEAGIGGIILENPFYGLRKPTDQVRSSLHNVSDIFVMGGCLILESLVLFHWCERNGLGPLGVTGLSMGGHMASLAATNWPKPLVLVPCLSWSTASAVFLQGVMSNSINWDLLEDQYLSDGEYREKLSKMVTIVDEAFLAGKKFARTYSETIKIPPPTEKASATDKKLDITYKENSANPNQSIIDVNRNIIEHEVPKNAVKSETITEIENLHNELRKLLNENKISVELYKKLISNEKFVLEPEDISYINNLSEKRVREVLLKCKVAGLQELLQTLQKQAEDKAAANDHIDQCISQNSELMDNPKPTIDSQKATMDNSKPTMDISKPTMDSSKPTMDSQKPTVDSSEANKELIKVVEEPKKVIIRKDKSWNISDFTSDLWLSLPFLKSIAKSGKKIDITKIHWRDRETLQFMRGIMDECTHLSNFSVPFDTSLIIAVCAKHDAYVPRDDVGTLEEIWPGAEVRYVDAGHVSAYILHQSLFRACIKEAFERSKKRWHNGAHIY